jgi:hypothetical protein
MRSFAILAVLYAAVMAGDVFCATVWVRPDAMLFLVMGLWLLAILLTVVILKAKPDFARLWWLYALMAFAFCAVLLPSFFVQASVLHERGVRDVAVVTSAQASGDSERMYRLSTSDGRPIAGWLRTDDGLAVGDPVEVVFDPARQFHPLRAEDVDEQGMSYGVLAVVFAMLYGIVLLFIRAVTLPGRGRTRAMELVYFAVPVTLAVGAVVLLVLGGRNAATVWRGTPGTVAVDHCTPHYNEDPVTYTCSGTFTAADGSFRIPAVDLAFDLDSRPDTPVPARALGAQASRAVRDGDRGWLVQLGGGLAFVVLAAGWFRSVGRAGSRRRES